MYLYFKYPEGDVSLKGQAHTYDDTQWIRQLVSVLGLKATWPALFVSDRKSM